MKRLDCNYTWGGDEELYQKRLSRLNGGDLTVVTGPYNGIGGDGWPIDPTLVKHVKEIKAKGAIPFGYVSSRQQTRHLLDTTTDWEVVSGEVGSLTLASFLDQVRVWSLFYGVDRIFLDDWPSTWGSRMLGACWGMCRGYVPAGEAVFIANPGTKIVMGARPPQGALIVTHENSIMPAGSSTPLNYECVIVHHSKDPLGDWQKLNMQGWSYGFVTVDGEDGNPFDGEPGA